MTSIKLSSITNRFFKGFVAGGIVQAGVILASNPNITSFEDLKGFTVALISGFFVGGLLAMQKMYTWKE